MSQAQHAPVDLEALPSWYRRPERVILYCCLLPAAFITPTAIGFDLSMTNALQTIPQFYEHFGTPSSPELGFFGAAQSLGGAVAMFVAPWICDRFGRRFPMMLGSFVIIGSTMGQVWALSFNMLSVFKLLLGIGIGLSQVGAPVLVAELAHPKERTAFTNFYNTTIYLGIVIGSWIAFGTYRIQGDWSWRLPCLLQIVCSVYQFFFIYLCPESPRWLISKQRSEEARAILVKYHDAGNPDSVLVDWEMVEISTAIAQETAEPLKARDFVKNKGLLWRAFLCICCGVFSQTSGNGLVSAYIVQILNAAGITKTEELTLINGGISIWSWIIGIASAILTARLRRRLVLLTGTTGMLVTFIGWTIAQARYDITGDMVAGRAVIGMIFLFNATNAFAWLYMVVTYPIEISPYTYRAKLWALTTFSIAMSGFFNQYINPIGLANIGWKYYIYYDVWILCELVIIYFLFPETSGRTLEEIAVVFDGARADVGQTTAAKLGIEIQHQEEDQPGEPMPGPKENDR